MADNQAEVRFGGDATGAISASQQAALAVKEAVNGMQSSLGSISEAFRGLTGTLIGLTAVLAGGKMFKEFVDEAVGEAGEVRKLSQAFGTTVEEANRLNVQLKLVGISSENYTDMAFKMQRQIKTNEAGLKSMGLAVRDAHGNFLPLNDVMKDGATLLMQYKAGQDRNAAAMSMFGRSAQDALQLIKLNNESQARANELIEKYGIGVTTSGVAAAKKYQSEMRAVGIVVEEVGQKIGDALIPVLTRGAGATMSAITGMLGYVEQGAGLLGDVLEEVADLIKASLELVVEIVNGLGQIIKEVFGFLIPSSLSDSEAGFASIGAVIKVFGLGFKIVFETIKFGVKEVVQAFITFYEVLKKVLVFDFSGAVEAVREGFGKMRQIAKESGDKMVQDAVKTQKRIADAFAGKGGEKKDGNEGADGSANRGKRTYHDKGDGKNKSRIDEWKAALVAKLEADKQYFRNTTDIELQYWEGVRARNSLSIEEKRQVNTTIYELHKKQATDLRALELQKIDSDKAIDMQELDQKRANLSLQESMGRISKQAEIEQLRLLKEQEYQLELQALQKKLEIIKEEGLARQKILDDVAALKAKHNADMVKQDILAFQQMKAKIENIFSPITSAFNTAISGIIQGTTTLKQAMANMAQSILLSFVNMGVQMLASWTATKLAEVIIGKTAAQEEGMAQAGAGAAAAMASVAAIPYVGWAMAPGVGAEHFAMASAFTMAGASAAGGFDIPAGVNPVTQLHQKEMVLPAHIAEPLRDSLASGGVGGGMNVTIHAVDGASVERLFRNNGHLLARELRRQSLNFAPTRA